MALTVEQARRELNEVTNKLKDFAALTQRKQMLEQFIGLAERLEGPANKSNLFQSQTIVMPKIETVICARDVLRKNGPLHLRDLVAKMYEAGWGGSPDRAKAEKTVYVSMHRNKAVFEKSGRNMWRARGQETKTAS